MGLYSSNCFSPPLSLSLSLPFSRFLAHSNDCHGNHQRCQTADKRKSFNIHLSQKEQNCSLITKGTIKTVHIYWQGTSHRSICSWIPKNEDRMGWGGCSWCWIWMSIWCCCDEKKRFNPRKHGRHWKCTALLWQIKHFLIISLATIVLVATLFVQYIYLTPLWKQMCSISIASNKEKKTLSVLVITSSQY